MIARSKKAASYSSDEEDELESFVFGNEASMLKNIDKNVAVNEDTATTSASADNTHRNEIGESLIKRKPAWHDDDDLETSRVKKNASLFAKNVGTPMWADIELGKKNKKNKLIKTGGAGSSEDETDNEEEDKEENELFAHTGNFLAKKKGLNVPLNKSIIDIKICTDANKEEPQQARLKAVEFHPNARVILTAGLNQKLSLFQIDGKNNPKIQTIFIDKFPVLNAHFSRNGEEIILGSRHKSFYYYDMIAGKMINVKPPVKAIDEHNRPGFGSNFEISPDNKYIAFVGTYGQIHLFSMKSKEHVETLKINGSCDVITFSADSRYLFAFGDDKAINAFDITKSGYDCVHKFNDFGCLSGTSLAVSSNSQFIATGCKSGVVNLYNLNECLLNGERNPKPLKSFMNLTTPCTSIKFNQSNELMAICSSYTENACKLIHVASSTVFTNFPIQTKQSGSIHTQMRIPQCIDLSPNSGYFTIGNHKGNALLYRLKHYASY